MSIEKSGKTSGELTPELKTSFEDDEGREPTEYEMKNLRHVSEKIPLRCWLVAVVELGERFTYYGLSAPFQNYMQNGPHDSPKGVLQLGNTGATGLSYFWTFWCYVSPILGAYVADTFLGKYTTILYCSFVYIVGCFILFITSIPSIASKSTSLGGYIAAIIIIGAATGGVKANVSPLIADQVPKTKPIIKVLPSGEKVIQDPNITIQNVFMFFYLMINIGSLSVIATTEMELHIGFWAAFLLPFCFFFVAIAALILGKNVYVKVPVSDKVISRCFKVCFIAIKNKFNFDAAKPSLHPESEFPWSDKFVEEVRRALYACKVFVFYPIYWLVYGQMLNNFVSQAGRMAAHGLPNDILQAVNSIAIIVFIPICEHWVYPFIRKFTPLKAVSRITIGFFFGSASMVYAAVLEYYIQKSDNLVHIAIQVPAYCLIGFSEIFASITGLEYAYTKAPISMKSFIMSIFLVQNAFGSALGIALSPVAAVDKVLWTFTGLAVSCFIAGVLFWLIFHHYNNVEEELNQLDYLEEDEVVANPDGLKPVTSLAKSYRSLN
ncbi:PTR2-domain-containing protein [Hyphopichia burtonii NRRL Y-1933]|uniref:PTR2-domain-containing protein n=1 Tax=Hyphopichia burtonii NRRL Y-1933 TaxID=984485 RepID=A0A1E4RSJ0_9ASCO|nr:PTR2-domain-containing protein [Hyphopichia burtonii NRRL Y-1933]ODV70252.1 PTR2-domain-containing protein [Hyphopichia burtonii NRRL Y-1933]